MPRDAAVDHVMVSADSANTSIARDVSCDERTPWSSNSESSPHYVPQPGKEKRLNKTGRQENTAASPSGPLTEAQLTSSAEAVTRPLPSNCSTPRKQQITSPPPPPPPPPKKLQNDNSFELQSMSFEDETASTQRTPQVCEDSCTAYHWASQISCHLARLWCFLLDIC